MMLVLQFSDHQFYHKWAILTTPKSEVFAGPRGYIKTDISILSKGSIPHVPTESFNDEIEGYVSYLTNIENKFLKSI